MTAIRTTATGKNWMIRYRLYQVPFWLMYNYAWWVVAQGSFAKPAHDLFFTPYAIKFSGYVIVQTLVVCFNLYFLIPRFLEKNRFVVYGGLLLLTTVAGALLIIPGYYLSSALSGKSMAALYGQDSDCFNHFFSTSFPSTVAAMTLAMSIKLAVNWVQTRRRQQQLEKEKLETELTFLKNQFNPHFLFNTINSIFFLIHKQPGLASSSLAKFSELLRYQLYECNDLQIPLNREIAYIENFIELEKLRQNDNMEVSLRMAGQAQRELVIAPFVLMTFVENAFKHVSKHRQRPNWIRIELELQDQHLAFSVRNSRDEQGSAEVVHYGGIGLKNVRRRLDLIYPDHYTLDIEETPDHFAISLHMELNAQVAMARVGRTEPSLA